MTPEQRRHLEAVTGRAVDRVSPLSGGCIAHVWRVDLDDGSAVVAKTGQSDGGFDIEAYMLRYLAEHSDLPVPEVLDVIPGMLVMSHLPASGGMNDRAQEHAADLIAALHGVTGRQAGLERDTLIGPLHQPNTQTDSWMVFFRDQRLGHFGDLAHRSGRLPPDSYRRLQRLREELDNWIVEPDAPSLLHGDLWGGNVLVDGPRIAGFVDPAIYYGEPEVDLAFSTLFSSFGDAFFRRYHERRPIAPGFFEERRDLYNLYPLLVHTQLFGGGYAGSADRILRRFVD